MIPALIILAWAACGVVAYGATLADFRRSFPTLAARSRRYGLDIAIGMGCVGPFGLLAEAISGRFRHGFMFRVPRQ